MANKSIRGLSYFPQDVYMMQDLKIRKLIRYQSGKAISVYTHLLSLIYREGYYLKWDESLPFVISEILGFEEGYILEVIKCCLNIDLFSKDYFDNYNILTSKGIQTRYTEIVKLLKRTIKISEYNLIPSEEMPIPSEEMPIPSEEMPIPSEEMPIPSDKRKEKEREIKERVSKDTCSEAEKSASEPEILLENILFTWESKKSQNDKSRGKNFIFTKNDLLAYQKTYDFVDVERELKKMERWLLSNPEKKKTFKGYPAFINKWLSNLQTQREAKNGAKEYYSAPRQLGNVEFKKFV